ncbi:MAG: nuclear transport factor 2 family protein, partial [Pseudomonadota bacterium]
MKPNQDCNVEHQPNPLLSELEACETGVWEALVRGDKDADNAALHDDFLGVYPDGFSEKSDHVRQLDDGPSVKSFALTHCRV